MEAALFCPVQGPDLTVGTGGAARFANVAHRLASRWRRWRPGERRCRQPHHRPCAGVSAWSGHLRRSCLLCLATPFPPFSNACIRLLRDWSPFFPAGPPACLQSTAAVDHGSTSFYLFKSHGAVSPGLHAFQPTVVCSIILLQSFFFIVIHGLYINTITQHEVRSGCHSPCGSPPIGCRRHQPERFQHGRAEA